MLYMKSKREEEDAYFFYCIREVLFPSVSITPNAINLFHEIVTDFFLSRKEPVPICQSEANKITVTYLLNLEVSPILPLYMVRDYSSFLKTISRIHIILHLKWCRVRDSNPHDLSVERF